MKLCCILLQLVVLITVFNQHGAASQPVDDGTSKHTESVAEHSDDVPVDDASIAEDSLEDAVVSASHSAADVGAEDEGGGNSGPPMDGVHESDVLDPALGSDENKEEPGDKEVDKPRDDGSAYDVETLPSSPENGNKSVEVSDERSEVPDINIQEKEEDKANITDTSSSPERVDEVLTNAPVVLDDEDLVPQLRGGKSYTGAVCMPAMDDLDDGVITMPPPPLDPACKAYFWTASVDEGYVPEITLESLNVEHKLGEFMIIGPGSDRDALWLDETNPMVTASVATARKFHVMTSNVFSVFLVTNTPTGFKGSFRLKYQPAGLLETTTETPTPGPSLPTPGPNVVAEVTIYLGGKPTIEYDIVDENNDTVTEHLRVAIAEMAWNYTQIKENNITLAEDITSDNVVFSLVRACDRSWVDSAICTQVNMSVAAHTTQSDRYEMTAAHLTDMWRKIDKHDARLSAINLYKYEAPNPARSMYLWLGLSVIVLILFIFILAVVWRVEIWDYRRMRSKSDSSYSNRSSTASTDSAWFPASEHQLVPPYMEAWSETGYVEYEPEFDGPVPAPKYQTVHTTPASVYSAPPRYGPPPNAFGGAVHFYGNTRRTYNNPAFVEDEEDEINAADNKGGLTLSNNRDNDNSNC